MTAVSGLEGLDTVVFWGVEAEGGDMWGDVGKHGGAGICPFMGERKSCVGGNLIISAEIIIYVRGYTTVHPRI